MLTIFLLMAAFAVLHSWLAGRNVKQAIRHRIGDRAYHGFYRLAYNFFAVLTLLPPFAIAILNPGNTVWQVEGMGQYILLSIQVIGVIGVGVSFLQIDWQRFAGIRQVTAYLKGETLPLPDEPLQIKGLYKVVRHPLYLFSLLAIWPMSTMSEALLAFNIGATLYFILGSILEERRLVAGFGEQYRSYQRNTSWLIPLPKIRH